MMTRILALVLLTSLCTAQEQDLKKNYTPLKTKNPLPSAFTQNIRAVVEHDIVELEASNTENKNLRSTFLTSSNYQIDRLLRSGNTLVNDEVTDYLNKITDVLLKDNPTLRKKLNVFTLKSPVVNAYSYDKAYVFINMGLIAQLESEAQLAFILSHEISHYTKQHHINGFVINDQIDKQSYGGNTESKLIEKCQYSKEFESEADIEGFKLFERTSYDLRQAEKGFSVLQYSHLPFELEEFKKSYFETPNFVIPSAYCLKEVSPIKDNSNEDDTRMTHPNTKKRRQAIADLIAQRDNTKRVKAIVSQQTFEYVRDLCRMELCRLYLKNRDYPNALYASYILAKKYPQNQYVAEVMAKSLYGISMYINGELRYTSDSYLPSGFTNYNDVESYPQQMYYIFDKLSAHETAVLALNKVYRDHKKFPESKSLQEMSDSLFKLLGRTRWGISDFARAERVREVPAPKIEQDTTNEVKSKTDLIASMQKEKTTSTEDTVFYKYTFADLFVSDQEFRDKFPMANTDGGNMQFSVSNNVRNYRESARQIPLYGGTLVDTVMVLEPFYYKLDDRDKEAMKYVSSDEKQEKYVTTISRCAQMMDFKLVYMDPGILDSTDAEKMNDFSVINDWFDERFDSDGFARAILNTNEINRVIEKYGTRYVLKSGVASLTSSSGAKRTYYLAFLFDLKKNEMLYRRFEIFKGKDSRDLVNAKTYQVLYDLKHPVKRKRPEDY